MKNIIYFLISLFVAIGAAFFLHEWLSRYDDPGYVLIGFGHWSMETSLVVFGIGTIIMFFCLYFAFRFLGWLLRLPGKMKHRSRNIKFNRSQEALIAGLVDSAEGNFENAEKVLIKHASNSGSPLIHYLTAAKAAQSRGAFEKRDEYLNLASKNAPGSEIAIGLTQAELHLSENQFNQALNSLTKIHKLDPTHASILKMMHQTYLKLGDWEGLRKLIPSLTDNQVLMEAELKLLETETFSMLLREAAENQDVAEIQSVWQSVPEHIQFVPGLKAIYFAAMIEIEAGEEIEKELVAELNTSWNDTLLVLYGSIVSKDPAHQLATAEKWMGAHSNDVVLLRVLGKLCIECGENEKADHYLTRSINVDPTVAAYQMLGDMLYKTGNKDRASDCFRRGLELASSEVVNQVDQINSATELELLNNQ